MSLQDLDSSSNKWLHQFVLHRTIATVATIATMASRDTPGFTAADD
jgi:hypothetical protein